MKSAKDFAPNVGMDVAVYKQDGGFWFAGTIARISGDLLIVCDSETGEDREVNPQKNEVEIE